MRERATYSTPPTRWYALVLLALWLVVSCRPAGGQTALTTGPVDFSRAPEIGEVVEKSEAEWRAELTAEQYHVLREEGTERAFTGAFWEHHDPGLYRCAGCGAPLYQSVDKFDSGTGWPSFTEPVAQGRITERVDGGLGMRRTEIECSACGGHLGHVFADGPPPTGRRHCVNSASLVFEPVAENEGGGAGGEPIHE